MKKAPENLPKIYGYTSETIIFKVKDVWYTGHYHMNGYFYTNSRRNVQMFEGKADRNIAYPKTERCPQVDQWFYLSEIDKYLNKKNIEIF